MSKQEEGENRLLTKGEATSWYIVITSSHSHIFTLSVIFAKSTFLLYLSISPSLLFFAFTIPQESERLEMLNSDLKAQIEELKFERQQLILMLNSHRPTCIVRTDSVKTPESEANPLLQQLEAK